jgi:hypothetical protein
MERNRKRRNIGLVIGYWFLAGLRTADRLCSMRPIAPCRRDIRTLPLSSYAKVTNLGSGRSVIVKINDRGPKTRRFIIDLSPRAAAELDMKRAGVASVAVEPISAETAAAKPTVATFRSTGTPVMQ